MIALMKESKNWGSAKIARYIKSPEGKNIRLAIIEGVDKGDSIADLEVLGLSQRTINMLEFSQYEIITVKQLMNHKREDLFMIPNMGEKMVTDLFKCLLRYEELDYLKTKENSTPNIFLGEINES